MRSCTLITTVFLNLFVLPLLLTCVSSLTLNKRDDEIMIAEVVKDFKEKFLLKLEETSAAYGATEYQELVNKSATYRDDSVVTYLTESARYVANTISQIEVLLSEVVDTVILGNASHGNRDDEEGTVKEETFLSYKDIDESSRCYNNNDNTQSKGNNVTNTLQRSRSLTISYSDSLVTLPDGRLYQDVACNPFLNIPITPKLKQVYDAISQLGSTNSLVELSVTSMISGSTRSYPIIAHEHSVQPRCKTSEDKGESSQSTWGTKNTIYHSETNREGRDRGEDETKREERLSFNTTPLLSSKTQLSSQDGQQEGSIGADEYQGIQWDTARPTVKNIHSPLRLDRRLGGIATGFYDNSDVLILIDHGSSSHPISLSHIRAVASSIIRGLAPTCSVVVALFGEISVAVDPYGVDVTNTSDITGGNYLISPHWKPNTISKTREKYLRLLANGFRDLTIGNCGTCGSRNEQKNKTDVFRQPDSQNINDTTNSTRIKKDSKFQSPRGGHIDVGRISTKKAVMDGLASFSLSSDMYGGSAKRNKTAIIVTAGLLGVMNMDLDIDSTTVNNNTKKSKRSEGTGYTRVTKTETIIESFKSITFVLAGRGSGIGRSAAGAMASRGIMGGIQGLYNFFKITGTLLERGTIIEEGEARVDDLLYLRGNPKTVKSGETQDVHNDQYIHVPGLESLESSTRVPFKVYSFESRHSLSIPCTPHLPIFTEFKTLHSIYHEEGAIVRARGCPADNNIDVMRQKGSQYIAQLSLLIQHITEKLEDIKNNVGINIFDMLKTDNYNSNVKESKRTNMSEDGVNYKFGVIPVGELLAYVLHVVDPEKLASIMSISLKEFYRNISSANNDRQDFTGTSISVFTTNQSANLEAQRGVVDGLSSSKENKTEQVTETVIKQLLKENVLSYFKILNPKNSHRQNTMPEVSFSSFVRNHRVSGVGRDTLRGATNFMNVVPTMLSNEVRNNINVVLLSDTYVAIKGNKGGRLRLKRLRDYCDTYGYDIDGELEDGMCNNSIIDGYSHSLLFNISPVMTYINHDNNKNRLLSPSPFTAFEAEFILIPQPPSPYIADDESFFRRALFPLMDGIDNKESSVTIVIGPDLSSSYLFAPPIFPKSETEGHLSRDYVNKQDKYTENDINPDGGARYPNSTRSTNNTRLVTISKPVRVNLSSMENTDNTTTSNSSSGSSTGSKSVSLVAVVNATLALEDMFPHIGCVIYQHSVGNDEKKSSGNVFSIENRASNEYKPLRLLETRDISFYIAINNLAIVSINISDAEAPCGVFRSYPSSRVLGILDKEYDIENHISAKKQDKEKINYWEAAGAGGSTFITNSVIHSIFGSAQAENSEILMDGHIIHWSDITSLPNTKLIAVMKYWGGTEVANESNKDSQNKSEINDFLLFVSNVNYTPTCSDNEDGGEMYMRSIYSEYALLSGILGKESRARWEKGGGTEEGNKYEDVALFYMSRSSVKTNGSKDYTQRAPEMTMKIAACVEDTFARVEGKKYDFSEGTCSNEVEQPSACEDVEGDGSDNINFFDGPIKDHEGDVWIHRRVLNNVKKVVGNTQNDVNSPLYVALYAAHTHVSTIYPGYYFTSEARASNSIQPTMLGEQNNVMYSISPPTQFVNEIPSRDTNRIFIKAIGCKTDVNHVCTMYGSVTIAFDTDMLTMFLVEWLKTTGLEHEHDVILIDEHTHVIASSSRIRDGGIGTMTPLIYLADFNPSVAASLFLADILEVKYLSSSDGGYRCKTLQVADKIIVQAIKGEISDYMIVTPYTMPCVDSRGDIVFAYIPKSTIFLLIVGNKSCGSTKGAEAILKTLRDTCEPVSENCFNSNDDLLHPRLPSHSDFIENGISGAQSTIGTSLVRASVIRITKEEELAVILVVSILGFFVIFRLYNKCKYRAYEIMELKGYQTNGGYL